MANAKAIVVDPLSDNNPITVQMLGICSALAVTVKMETAMVMCGENSRSLSGFVMSDLRACFCWFSRARSGRPPSGSPISQGDPGTAKIVWPICQSQWRLGPVATGSKLPGVLTKDKLLEFPGGGLRQLAEDDGSWSFVVSHVVTAEFDDFVGLGTLPWA